MTVKWTRIMSVGKIRSPAIPDVSANCRVCVPVEPFVTPVKTFLDGTLGGCQRNSLKSAITGTLSNYIALNSALISLSVNNLFFY